MKIEILANRKTTITFVADIDHTVCLSFDGLQKIFNNCNVSSEEVSVGTAAMYKITIEGNHGDIYSTVQKNNDPVLYPVLRGIYNAIPDDLSTLFPSPEQEDKGLFYKFEDDKETKESLAVIVELKKLLPMLVRAMNEIRSLAEGGDVTLDYTVRVSSNGQPFMDLMCVFRFGKWMFSIANVNFYGARGSAEYFGVDEPEDVIRCIRKRLFYYMRPKIVQVFQLKEIDFTIQYLRPRKEDLTLTVEEIPIEDLAKGKW